MKRVHKRCAGLDVHKKTVAACVRRPGPAGERTEAVRTFGTTAAELGVLRDWLAAHGVTHVAMESTGVYWKPVYYALEATCTVLLVNAAHIKQVPGRKTDVADCVWIARLLEHGLVRGSFVPPPPIRDLRDLTRYRAALIDDRVRAVNRLHKVLEDAGVKLATVASDVLGASGRAMLEALAAGTTDPAILADLARGTLRKKLPALEAALTGHVRPHHAFLVREVLRHVDALDAQVATLSARVTEALAPFAAALTRLQTIPGVGQRAADVILAEIGPDMRVFPTAGHLASWAGVCPGHHESAGRRKSGRMRKGDPWLRRVLTQSALAALHRRDGAGALGARYRRLRRRGHQVAVGAVVHAQLVAAYHILAHNTVYRDLGADYFDQRAAARAKHRALHVLERQGYRVTLERAA